MKAEEFLINKAVICKFADGGGNDMVTLDDAKQALTIAHEESVKKWNMWCFNYPTPFEGTICDIWGGNLSRIGEHYHCKDNHFSQHLIEKWQSHESKGDARMMFFFSELDDTNRNMMIEWVMREYRG